MRRSVGLLCLGLFSPLCHPDFSLTLSAVEKSHIIVEVAGGIMPEELVISRSGDDPMKKGCRVELDNGRYECDIQSDYIEEYKILDLGELKRQGHTTITTFMIEDGAVITLTSSAAGFNVSSTGKEMLAAEKMDSLAKEIFSARYEQINTIDDEKEAGKREAELMADYNDWIRKYYADNQMIDFLLNLDKRMSQPNFEDHSLYKYLEIYHSTYTGSYPGHPAHDRIAEAEKFGYQLYGGKYNDYDVRTIEGEKVRGYDYIKPGYNLVICWATWCAPCRGKCQEIAEFIGPYMDAGLNVFALTREFENTGALKNAVENDRYPWPTLVDLDNEFNVFDRHGAVSSAVFLINPEKEIVFTGSGSDEVKEALETYMPEVK